MMDTLDQIKSLSPCPPPRVHLTDKSSKLLCMNDGLTMVVVLTGVDDVATFGSVGPDWDIVRASCIATSLSSTAPMDDACRDSAERRSPTGRPLESSPSVDSSRDTILTTSPGCRRTHRRTRPTTHLALQERKELFQAEGAVTVGVEPLDQRPHVLSRQR